MRGIPFERQKHLPVRYKQLQLDSAYRLDLLVAGQVVVEIKAVEDVAGIHKAQLLTYLRLGGWKVGLLLNFNVPRMTNGIHRMVLGLEE